MENITNDFFFPLSAIYRKLIFFDGWKKMSWTIIAKSMTNFLQSFNEKSIDVLSLKPTLAEEVRLNRWYTNSNKLASCTSRVSYHAELLKVWTSFRISDFGVKKTEINSLFTIIGDYPKKLLKLRTINHLVNICSHSIFT